MPPDAGLPGEDGIVLPPLQNLTSMRFEKYGLYLIDDGQTQFLWVGRDAVPQLVQDVFGKSSLEQLAAGKVNKANLYYFVCNVLIIKTTLPLLENPFSQRVVAVVGKSRAVMTGSLYYPHLFVVKEDGDPALRTWALTFLIEDRTENQPSYQQFLGELRSKVRY